MSETHQSDWKNRAPRPQDVRVSRAAQQRDDQPEVNVSNRTRETVKRYLEEHPFVNTRTYEAGDDFEGRRTQTRIAREGLGARNQQGFMMSATKTDGVDHGHRAPRESARRFVERSLQRDSRGSVIGIAPVVQFDPSQGDRLIVENGEERYVLGDTSHGAELSNPVTPMTFANRDSYDVIELSNPAGPDDDPEGRLHSSSHASQNREDFIRRHLDGFGMRGLNG
ncbi:hypothetical protein [Nocardiopsis sp. HUAS JQ3]|uniref:hypothetical protein n=1 Tax=Nocardiopsis sp. HUAS JQ3 TaxID=3061629 RepID=UPI0023A9400F|nr:hypothetical protein [Nocardiopsis sp. HUAS JQ3]WDZ91193.1 hypothetical protein PV789_01030 [Nocardiopsis sp. HUAS JQ3]